MPEPCARHSSKHYDCHDEWSHGHVGGINLDACGLQIQLKHGHAAEQHGAD